MAKKYSRLQPKLRPLPFVIMGVVIVAFVVFLILLTPTAKQRFLNAYNNSGADLPKNHVFVDIEYNDIVKKLNNKENFVLYIGSPSCQTCVSEVKYYDQYFKESNLSESLDNIYYFSATSFAKHAEDFYAKTGIEVESTPQVFYFHQGNITFKRSDSQFQGSGTAAGEIKQFFQAIENKQ